MLKQKVTIVDYDCGNIFSIQRALANLGADSYVAKDPRKVKAADRIILPGVGAFGDGMGNLKKYGLDAAILDFIRKGKPVLGICLGMQLLLQESFEFGQHEGLNLFPGKVNELSREGGIKIPHIGWSAIYFSDAAEKHRLFADINSGSYMYFLHSFFVDVSSESHSLAKCRYGNNEFTAVIGKENILGVQFHPEISGVLGLKILENFLNKI